MLRAAGHVLAVLCCLGGAAGAAGAAELTPEELRSQAGAALQAGAPGAALEMTGALLTRDAGDVEALVIRARALRDLGRNGEAQTVARRAWAAAETPGERYASSLVMAQALSSDGRRTMAQLWLRRAVQHAPSEGLRRVAIRDFRYVRQRNPWSTQLSFNIAPTSNVNNGSIRSTTRLFDLPFDFELSGQAQALSGTEIAAGIATRYRLSESKRHQNDLLFRAEHRTYRLSDEAKRQAPAAKGSDFAFSSVSGSYVHRGVRPGGPGPYELRLTGGRSWYGGDPLFNFVRAGATQQFVLSKRTATFASVTREIEMGLGSRNDARKWTLATGIAHRFENGNRLDFSVSATESASRHANLDFTRLGAEVRYTPATPVLGMSFEYGLAAAMKDHDRSNLTAAGRHDTEVTASVTAVFRQIDLYGFVPSLTYTYRSTDSNIGLFDSREQGVQFGIESAF